ncbi:MAG: hypothetical protein ACI32N_01055 [Bulleidia sp.]
MELKIRPRKKPVIVTSCILIVLIAVMAYIMNVGGQENAGITGGLTAALIFLLICVVGGYARSVIIFRNDGIYSVTALFARPVHYKWKAVDRVLHEGRNYSLYSTQNKWIGAIDERHEHIQEALDILASHKIRVKEIQSEK